MWNLLRNDITTTDFQFGLLKSKDEYNFNIIYPEIVRFEARYFFMWLADICEEGEERIQVVKTFDAFVERVHDLGGVFGQFHTVSLFLSRL